MKIAKQQVNHVDNMGSDLSVVNAARVSFGKESDWNYEAPAVCICEGQGCMLCENIMVDQPITLMDADVQLLKYLAKHNHWSPFAHTSISIRVKAPIFVARQLAKHQVGFSWNEVSRRYVSDEPEFYIPDSWRKVAANVKQGSSDEAVADSDLFVTYIEDASDDALDFYNELLTEGVCAEQARMVLPQNMMTEWIWTGSLTGFHRVCQLRLDSHTQLETQEVAEMIGDLCAFLYPFSWRALNDSSFN